MQLRRSARRSTGAVARERLALAHRARCDDPPVPLHGKRAHPVGTGAEVAEHEAAVTKQAVESTSTAVPTEGPGRRVESIVVEYPPGDDDPAVRLLDDRVRIATVTPGSRP